MLKCINFKTKITILHITLWKKMEKIYITVGNLIIQSWSYMGCMYVWGVGQSFFYTVGFG